MQTSTAARRCAALISTAFLVAVGSVAVASPANAATFPASTEAELVAAITAANADPGADTIVLSGTGFTLTGNLPTITSDLTIEGPGQTFVIVGDSFNGFDLLGINADRIDVSISDIAISGLSVTTVRSEYTNLILDTVLIEDNQSGLDFADGNLLLSRVDIVRSDTSGADLDLRNTDNAVIVNSTFNDNAEYGIWAEVVDTSSLLLSGVDAYENTNENVSIELWDLATLSTENVTATGSDSNHGFRLRAEDTATAILTQTSASLNEGIGLLVEASVESTVSIDGLETHSNHGVGVQLATWHEAAISTTDSRSSGNDFDGIRASANSADALISIANALSTDNLDAGVDARVLDGGTVELTGLVSLRNDESGVAITSGGDETVQSGLVSLTAATIDDNDAPSGGGVFILGNTGLSVTIDNSTISNNDADLAGGLSATFGSGNSLEIVNSTISGNEAEFIGGLHVANTDSVAAPNTFLLAHSTVVLNNSAEYAPAVEIAEVATTIHHSIIDGNRAGAGNPAGLFLDTVATVDHSLINYLDGANAEATASAGTGNILGVGSNLGPLADNGGSTLTHLPALTSPVIGAGDPAVAGAPATDQRGLTRIVGIIDIGSVEVPAVVVPGVPPGPAVLPATGANPVAPLAAGGLLTVLGLGMFGFAARARRSVES